MIQDIDAIASLIERGELVLFVGAGISLAEPSGMWGFQQLQNELLWALCQNLEPELKSSYGRIYEEIREKRVSSEIAGRFLAVPPEYVFQLCNQAMLLKNGTAEYYELQSLNVFSDSVPNQNHLTLAHLLTTGHIPAIFTTNFDVLIESAIDQLPQELRNKRTIRRCWKREHFEEVGVGEPTIFKLHGTVDDLRSIVVSLDEIGKSATLGKPRSLRYFLERYYVLFLGYRGADIDIFSYLATTDCKGMLWNTRSEEHILPKVRRLLTKQNGRVVRGDLCDILDQISEKLRFPKVEAAWDLSQEPRDLAEDLLEWASNVDTPSKLIVMGDLWEYVGEWRKAARFFRSGLEWTREAQSQALENVFLGRLVKLWSGRKRFGEARNYCATLFENAAKLSPPLRLYEYVHALQMMALIEVHEDPRKGIMLLSQSMEYQERLEEIDDKTRRLRGDILLNAGKIVHQSQLLSEALEFYSSALAIYDEFGNVHGRAKALANEGSIFLAQGKVDDCIHLYKEAEYLFGETGDVCELSVALLNLAKAYYSKGNAEEAREYATRAMEYFELLSDKKRYQTASQFVKD